MGVLCRGLCSRRLDKRGVDERQPREKQTSIIGPPRVKVAQVKPPSEINIMVLRHSISLPKRDILLCQHYSSTRDTSAGGKVVGEENGLQSQETSEQI